MGRDPQCLGQGSFGIVNSFFTLPNSSSVTSFVTLIIECLEQIILGLEDIKNLKGNISALEEHRGFPILLRKGDLKKKKKKLKITILPKWEKAIWTCGSTN